MTAEKVIPTPLYHSPLPDLDESWIVRFERFVNREGDCHVWMGYRTPGGYGHLQIQKRPWRAHRLAWLVSTGEDPAERLVLHTCDNPPCVRFDHLFLGTPGDNMQDMAAKGRSTGWRGLTLRGSDNGNSRLTWTEVDEIRAVYGRREATQTALAEQFGVSQTLISEIVRGKRWVR